VTQANEHAARRMVDRCFEGRLPPRQWEDLFVHLRGCPACREYFERERLAFRALGGGQAPAAALGRAEADLIRDALLPPPSPLRRRLAWLGAAAVLAGGLAAIVLVSPSPPSGTFVERGAESPQQAFDLLCIPDQEDRPTVSVAAALGRCAPGSFLKVVVTRPDPARPHVTIVALDPSWRIRSTVRTEAVGHAPVVASGHLQLASGDALLFVAIFSRDGIDDSGLQQAIERARASAATVDDLRELPLAGVAQLRLRVRATEAAHGH
jgi:hypothetical protein